MVALTGGDPKHMEMLNQQTKNWETRVDHPYLDSAGKRTIGWGTNIDARSRHDLVRWNDNKTSDEVWQELQSFDEHKGKNYKANFFNSKTNAKITPEEADRLYNMDIKTAADGAIYVFKSYDQQHPKLQEVLNDMAYNLGRGKLAKYKNFAEHINNGDYMAAAEESNRRGIENNRNQWTKERLRLHGQTLQQMQKDLQFYPRLRRGVDFPEAEPWWRFLKRYL